MKKIKLILLTVFSSFLLASCSVEPTPIAYGEHNCNYCEMTIMDPRYGSEIVTETGKVYMFDAIECMVNFLRKELPEDEKAELILFTDFENPKTLVHAENGVVLHSPGLPSPMGMYLTGFEDLETARQMQARHGGSIYEWHVLQRDFDKVKEGFN